VGLGARYTPTRHHVKSLAATSSRPNPKTLAAREVLAHPRVMFYPYMCGLCRGAAVVVAALIGHGGARSLLGQGRGGGDRLLPLYYRATTLDHCSNSSSTALHI
jgi:hypothetical protein